MTGALESSLKIQPNPGEYGAIINWFHMACARHDDIAVAYAKLGETKMSKTIIGFAELPVDMTLGLEEVQFRRQPRLNFGVKRLLSWAQRFGAAGSRE